MAKVDDYQMSFDLAVEKLANQDFKTQAGLAGAELEQDGSSARLAYFGRPVRISADPVEVTHLDDGPEIPLAEKALIMHYLVNATGREPTGDWVTFREVPSGEFYWSAFVKRAKDPLVGFFGTRPEFLLELAPLVGGSKAEDISGDAAVLIQAFPRVPLILQLYAGDDEFPADGNVLMDRTISDYLSTEDVALTSGLPIYKMMALSRNRG